MFTNVEGSLDEILDDEQELDRSRQRLRSLT